MRIGEDCPSALWRRATYGLHSFGKWLYRATLDAEATTLQDAFSLIPADKDASTSSGLLDAIIEIARDALIRG